MAFYYNQYTGRTLATSAGLSAKMGPDWITGDQAVSQGLLFKTPGGKYMKAPRKSAVSQTTTGTSSLSTGAKAGFEKAIAQYAPEGGFGKGVEAGLERGRVKAVASGTQAMVSAGLAGTSVMAGLGKKYEEEVAAPTRAGVESERAGRLSSLYAVQAGAEQSAYESAESRSLQEYLQQYRGGGGGYGEISTPGLDAFGKPMRGSVQQQQLDIQRQELALRKKGQQENVAQFTGGLSSYGQDYYGSDSMGLVKTSAYQGPLTGAVALGR